MVQAYIFSIWRRFISLPPLVSVNPSRSKRPGEKSELIKQRIYSMDNMTIIAVASIVTAGITIGIGVLGPALGEGKAVATAVDRPGPTA